MGNTISTVSVSYSLGVCVGAVCQVVILPYLVLYLPVVFVNGSFDGLPANNELHNKYKLLIATFDY